MKNNNEIEQNSDSVSDNKGLIRKIKELEDGLDPIVLARQILIKGENKRIFADYVLKIREKTLTYSKIEEEFLKFSNDSPHPIAAGIPNSAHLTAICDATPPYFVTNPAISFVKIQS